MIIRILNAFCCVVSFAGMIVALVLMFKGSRPCGSDGCLIRLLLLLGGLMMLVFGPLFYSTFQNEMKRQKRNA
jgi:hypothetical protein